MSLADFTGPQSEWKAMSPDGNLVVRISEKRDYSELSATYYEYDAMNDEYARGKTIPVLGRAQMLYVSNAGDLIMIALGQEESISLYSKDGKLTRQWSLKDFLTAKEIKACAKTGSTLQWFDEGTFANRTFHFRGPSRRIRGLQPSYTVMRGADSKISFFGTVDAKSGTLSKDDSRRR